MLNANKIIYSLRIYLSLKEMGIEPIATNPNPWKPNFMFWIYKKDEKFEEALNKIMSE